MLVLLHLFTLFLLVLLGFYVFVGNPRSRAHQTFAAFISFLALWTTKDLIFWNFHSQNSADDWWAAASFIIALLMQCSLVIFAWVFPEDSRTPRRRAAILFAPGLVLVPSAMFGLLWQTIGFTEGSFVLSLAPLAYAFVAYVYFLFFYGAIVLLAKYRKYRGTQKGQQVGAILWGLGITGALKTLANIVFPYFGIYGLLPFSSIFALPGVFIYAYAILNFRLFSLQTALDQFRLFPLAYKVALSIASVAIFSFLLFQVPIVWWAFGGADLSYESWRRYLVFSIVSALFPNLLLVLLVLRSVSRPLQKITLAAVQVTRGQYGTEVDLRQSNDEIGLLADSFNDMSRKMASDIRELHDLNEQLIRTERLAAMGTLATGVAHEVNNPLASISSLIQMMRSQTDLGPETKEKLELVLTQIRRISQVTKDMTDFASPRPSVRSIVNINDVVRTSLRLASFDKVFQNLQVVAELPEDIGNIYANPDELQQVFLNILLNARDAMPDGGTLTVSSRREDGWVKVDIRDTGTGIDIGDVERLFDPFFTTKPSGKGTGLGLAVCYGIVSAHGGQIKVYGGNKSGAQFVIEFPLGNEV